jgi:hypothetical protein
MDPEERVVREWELSLCAEASKSMHLHEMISTTGKLIILPLKSSCKQLTKPKRTTQATVSKGKKKKTDSDSAPPSPAPLPHHLQPLFDTMNNIPVSLTNTQLLSSISISLLELLAITKQAHKTQLEQNRALNSTLSSLILDFHMPHN